MNLRINRSILQVNLLWLMLFSVLSIGAADFDENIDLPTSFPYLAKAVSDRDVREIRPGQTIERTIKAGDVNDYQITLEAGTSVEVNIGKHDLVFGLSYFIPEDTNYTVPGTGAVIDGPKLGLAIVSDYGLVEPLVLVAEKTGKYIIHVSAHAPGGGSYSLTCGPAHTTTERDRKYAQAGRDFVVIRATVVDAGHPFEEVRKQIESRVAIYREVDDKKGLALSLKDMALMHADNGEVAQAQECLSEARWLFEQLDSRIDVIYVLGTAGSMAADRGDYQEVIDRKMEVLSIRKSMHSPLGEADALFSLAITYHRLADEQKAREYYQQALAIFEAINPPTQGSLNRQITTHTNFSNLSRGMNGGELPIDFFPPRSEKDWRNALEHSKKALDLDDQMERLFPPNQGLKTFNLWQMGNTYKELGDYAESLAYLNHALDIYRSVKPTNIDNFIVRVLHDIADVHVKKGEYAKALEYLNESEDLVHKFDFWGYLDDLGKAYCRAGQPRKGLELLLEALAAFRKREMQVDVAATLFEIARTERELGNFDNARLRIEEAMQIAESLRAKITADDLKTTYFSTVKRYYDFYIDLLMQAHKSQPEKGFDALALQTSEKARSKSLQDLLVLSRIDINQGIDPALLDREKVVRAELTQKAYQQSRLLLAKHTEDEAAKIGQEVTKLTNEYSTIQADIRNKSPRYAALTQPSSLNTKQIQQLLDSGTVLLEYSLGEKKSYLWVVSSNSVASFDLLGRDQIEAGARKVYGLMTERNRQVKGETVDQTQARARVADAEYPKVAVALSEMLLGPAADVIRNKRLVIVPDGALNYISFSALPLPKTQDPNTIASASKSQEPNTLALVPLGSYHEVVTLPSASTLARLREETASRKPAAKMVAIFADPVFNPSDSRTDTAPKGKLAVADNKSQNLIASRDFERAVSDVGLSAKETEGLPRLPFSRREADAIFNVSPKALSLKDVDFNASKQQVFNSNLDQYRIVHFATHGLLDSQHPELSGVVLSLVDKNGADIDGFLRLQDIYNLKLNADLVVLSACNTALGKEVKGEGLIGLTRGFMYAGAPRVVASLWKVDDAATAELMTIFYRKMLIENLRPAAALRAAQTEMMKQPRWRSPYYWAPFVLQGEWK